MLYFQTPIQPHVSISPGFSMGASSVLSPLSPIQGLDTAEWPLLHSRGRGDLGGTMLVKAKQQNSGSKIAEMEAPRWEHSPGSRRAPAALRLPRTSRAHATAGRCGSFPAIGSPNKNSICRVV